MDLTLVSHTHWDREWYRTFEEFRARLVDTVDRVLELVEEDSDFRFLLDGQTIVLEDYLEVRPSQRKALESACRSGKIAIGPWYVQPDSLLPDGETHVRNLLEGRRVGEAFGGVSSVAYTPDSFGHPAQFPQIFAGFGLGPFIYWRGNGSEIDSLPAEYQWEAPDGSSVLAHHLGEGYFGACGLPEDVVAAAAFLQDTALRLAGRTRGDAVLLMNGIDHAAPDGRAGVKLEALARATGWRTRRGLLEDFVAQLEGDPPRYAGELVGGRLANLLPGVWSSRMPIKQRNRSAETALLAWAEPFAALGVCLGTPDERPSLRQAWRALLPNQAHDSICGCSRDRVHEQSIARYDEAQELADQTTRRLLERIAGQPIVRRTPWSDELDIAVFNPSSMSKSDRVRISLDADPWLEYRGEFDRSVQVHPFLGAAKFVDGFTVDGEPARLVSEPEREGIRITPRLEPRAIEFVAQDVPAFGWRRFRLAPSDAWPEEVDEERVLEADGITLGFADDGTFSVDFGEMSFSGLGAIEDVGDRGDTYDFDPVAGGDPLLESVTFRRWRHASGLCGIRSRRIMRIPAELAADRQRRSSETETLTIDLEACLSPGTSRVDLALRIEDPANDHRLRLLFPTGRRVDSFQAATTFDVAQRSTSLPDDEDWIHPAPRTFCQQGFVLANGLLVAAPGLPEAEVRPDGCIAITMLRSVGWLARQRLTTRPEPAGPMVATPGAQGSGVLQARLSLFAGEVFADARGAETGLRAVVAGETPLVPPGESLLRLEPPELMVTALKPAESGEGFVLRLLNPSDREVEAQVSVGLAIAEVNPVRLDETGATVPVDFDGSTLRCRVAAHGLVGLHFLSRSS